jgi:hypothetical protein
MPHEKPFCMSGAENNNAESTDDSYGNFPTDVRGLQFFLCAECSWTHHHVSIQLIDATHVPVSEFRNFVP